MQAVQSTLLGGLLVLALGGSLQAQSTVTIKAELAECQGSVALFTFDGFDLKEFKRVLAGPNNTFEFTLPKSEPRFFYLGEFNNSNRPVVLGSESGVVIKGSCKAIGQAQVLNSPVNSDYETIKTRIGVIVGQSNQGLRAWAGAPDEASKATALQNLQKLDQQKLNLLDSLKKAAPFLARVVALNTYLSFPNYGKGYPGELEYFATDFFKFADFSDPGYNGLPWVYEAARSYATTLAGVGLPENELQHFLEFTLGKFPKGQSAHQMAYAGILEGLQQRKSPLFVKFADNFIKDFKTQAPQAVAQLEADLKAVRRLAVGADAPDFGQATPEGKSMNLSDLRGKYVLIDFWASWCGPCRRENPNVVRMYDQYKTKGFEILGVSLDQNREAWLKAIAADKLTWPHVSDLRGWSNAAAQLYEVSAIPQTYLIDPSGKILAKGLRGPSLEAKLAELLDR